MYILGFASATLGRQPSGSATFGSATFSSATFRRYTQKFCTFDQSKLLRRHQNRCIGKLCGCSVVILRQMSSCRAYTEGIQVRTSVLFVFSCAQDLHCMLLRHRHDLEIGKWDRKKQTGKGNVYCSRTHVFYRAQVSSSLAQIWAHNSPIS